MNKKGLLLVVSTAVISGFSIFLNKFGVSVADPYVFSFLKNVVVALVLFGVILLFKDIKLLRQLKLKQWLTLVLIGLIGGSIPFLLFFKGLSLTSAAQGSFIQKTMFVYVAILAIIFLKERISKNFLIGALLLLLGNVLALKSLNFSFGLGDLLIFLATLLWAIENVFSKHVLKKIAPNLVAWGRMFFGSIFIFFYLSISGQIEAASSLNPTQVIWVAITAILLFGYVITWYNGLKNIPVSLATAVLLLGSPITTALTAAYAGKIAYQELLSGALVLSGLVAFIGFDHIRKKIKALAFLKN